MASKIRLCFTHAHTDTHTCGITCALTEIQQIATSDGLMKNHNFKLSFLTFSLILYKTEHAVVHTHADMKHTLRYVHTLVDARVHTHTRARTCRFFNVLNFKTEKRKSWEETYWVLQ